MTRSLDPRSTYAPLLAAVHAVLAAQGAVPHKALLLLRVAAGNLERCAAGVTLGSEPAALSLAWIRCAEAESALHLALQEARRRRLIPSDAYQRQLALLAAARTARGMAMRQLGTPGRPLLHQPPLGGEP